MIGLESDKKDLGSSYIRVHLYTMHMLSGCIRSEFRFMTRSRMERPCFWRNRRFIRLLPHRRFGKYRSYYRWNHSLRYLPLDQTGALMITAICLFASSSFEIKAEQLFMELPTSWEEKQKKLDKLCFFVLILLKTEREIEMRTCWSWSITYRYKVGRRRSQML